MTGASAMADDVTVSATIEAGMDLFITKPFTYEVLAELLKPIFASRTSRGPEQSQGLGLGLGLSQGHGLGQGLGFGSGRTPRTNKLELVDVFETIHEDDYDTLPYVQPKNTTTSSQKNNGILTHPVIEKSESLSMQEKVSNELPSSIQTGQASSDTITQITQNEVTEFHSPLDSPGKPSLRSRVDKELEEDKSNDAILDVSLAGAYN